MQEGVSAAYNAVMKPAEGTILTVSRLAGQSRAMAASAEKNERGVRALSRPSHRARRRCAQTVDMNPVLKKAGVVDAGGKGFLADPEGNARGAARRGHARALEEPSTPRATRRTSPPSATRTSPLPSTPCSSSAASTTSSIEPFREFLNSIGDSLGDRRGR